MILHGIELYLMVLHCILWYWIVSYGIALVLHGISLYCMVLHGIARCCIVLYGIALYHINSYDIAWYCIVPLLASARGLYLARHLSTLSNCWQLLPYFGSLTPSRPNPTSHLPGAAAGSLVLWTFLLQLHCNVIHTFLPLAPACSEVFPTKNQPFWEFSTQFVLTIRAMVCHSLYHLQHCNMPFLHIFHGTGSSCRRGLSLSSSKKRVLNVELETYKLRVKSLKVKPIKIWRLILLILEILKSSRWPRQKSMSSTRSS